ncbi:MAG TPA: hypothetical protein PLD88_11615, partial [Candidatus Berkiella sp.]|nr:hypothetical protein [Candidatus Berkiella sp.]
MQTIKWVDTPVPPPAAAASVEKKIARLEKKLLHYTGKAIGDYGMIEQDDKILVCVSGGKDSITMLLMLEALRKRAPLKFEIMAFTLDQAQPGWNDQGLRAFF